MINSVTIAGNLGKDAELRMTQSGSPVMNFSIAVNEGRKDANGNWNDYTNWFNCVMFGNRAEKLVQYLKKGTKVALMGKLGYREWTTKDGQQRNGVEIVVLDVEFMSKRNDDGYSKYDDGHSKARQEQAEYVQATYFDDDCPF